MRQCFSQSLHSSTVIPGSRRQAEVGNFHASQAPGQLNSAHGQRFAKIIYGRPM